jgi:FkbM family methyltransferase
MIKKLYKKILNRLKRIKLLANRFGDNEKRIRYKGIDVYYSKGTSIIDRVLVDGVYEEEFSESLIEELLNKNSKYFLDIGANIGLISCNILDAVKGIKIYAFEPSPHAVQYLQKTISENQLDDSIDLNTSALSFENGEVEFAVHSAAHTSGNGIFDTGRSGKTTTIKVKTVKLDDWWQSKGGPDIKVVKMDTEGAELWILRGAEAFVEQCKPVIFLEIHPDNIMPYPYEAADYLKWASEHKYTLMTSAGDRVDEENLASMLKLTQDYVLKSHG